MPTSQPADLIVVASHRGGSMKTTLCASLALALARREHDVLLVDFAMAGGAFSLEHPGFTPAKPIDGLGIPDVRFREHRSFPLRLLHAPRGLSSPGALGELRRGRLSPTPEIVIADTPACGSDELGGVLKQASLLLIALPANALALRSLASFLQTVSEIRSLPGRSFDIAVVPTGTGGRSHEAVALDRYANRYLGPLMSGAAVPIDEGVAAAVSGGKFPDVEEDNSTTGSNLTLLARTVLERLKRAGASVGT